MLINHIEQIQNNDSSRLSESVTSWYTCALEAVKECKKIERQGVPGKRIEPNPL